MMESGNRTCFRDLKNVMPDGGKASKGSVGTSGLVDEAQESSSADEVRHATKRARVWHPPGMYYHPRWHESTEEEPVFWWHPSERRWCRHGESAQPLADKFADLEEAAGGTCRLGEAERALVLERRCALVREAPADEAWLAAVRASCGPDADTYPRSRGVARVVGVCLSSPPPSNAVHYETLTAAVGACKGGDVVILGAGGPFVLSPARSDDGVVLASAVEIVGGLATRRPVVVVEDECTPMLVDAAHVRFHRVDLVLQRSATLVGGAILEFDDCRVVGRDPSPVEADDVVGDPEPLVEALGDDTCVVVRRSQIVARAEHSSALAATRSADQLLVVFDSALSCRAVEDGVGAAIFVDAHDPARAATLVVRDSTLVASSRAAPGAAPVERAVAVASGAMTAARSAKSWLEDAARRGTEDPVVINLLAPADHLTTASLLAADLAPEVAALDASERRFRAYAGRCGDNLGLVHVPVPVHEIDASPDLTRLYHSSYESTPSAPLAPDRFFAVEKPARCSAIGNADLDDAIFATVGLGSNDLDDGGGKSLRCLRGCVHADLVLVGDPYDAPLEARTSCALCGARAVVLVDDALEAPPAAPALLPISLLERYHDAPDGCTLFVCAKGHVFGTWCDPQQRVPRAAVPKALSALPRSPPTTPAHSPSQPP